jgi:lipopolysaccharide biosynthesis regulator YciM
LIYIEDKLAKDYFQTEINDRAERRFNSLLDIVQELTDENEKLKECVQGLLALVKGGV